MGKEWKETKLLESENSKGENRKKWKSVKEGEMEENEGGNIRGGKIQG